MIHLDAYEWEGSTYVRTWETETPDSLYPKVYSRICRHCGLDLATLHPEANAWPHTPKPPEKTVARPNDFNRWIAAFLICAGVIVVATYFVR